MTRDRVQFTFQAVEQVTKAKQNRSIWSEVAWATVGGLTLTAAFPIAIPGFEVAHGWLERVPRELFAYAGAGFFYTLHRAPRRRALRAGWAAFVHFATLLFWLNVAMMDFAGMAWFLALPVHVLLAGYCALYLTALPTLTVELSKQTRLPPWLCFGSAVVVLEWLRGHLLTGFPWGLWGYSQARNLPLANLAAWGGVYLVSAVIALGAGWLVHAWTTRNRRQLVTASAFVAACHLAGAIRWSGSDPGAGVRVALLQGNIDQHLKNDGADSAAEISRIYRELVSRVSRPVDLVVWPESSWPYPIGTRTSRFEVDSAVPMVVGVVEVGYTDDGPVAHNSAIYVDASGRIVDRQRKLHLVPFGEYVPFREILPVDKVVPGMVDMSPGEGATPVSPERIGIQICYDGIFPEINREHVRAGAELIANLTNDGWYGYSSGPYQHLDFYVFRAIESDRYLIRATNTGVSAVIGPRGRVRAESELGARTVLRGEVKRRASLTLYAWLGDWVVALAGLHHLVAAGLFFRARLTRARSPEQIRSSMDSE